MAKIILFAAFAAFLLFFGCASDMRLPQGQLNSTQCDALGGRLVNTLGGSCSSGESNAGEVEGLQCPCICCVPSEPQRHRMNSTDCDSLGGRVINRLGESCASGERDAGDIEGVLCPCVCCVPKN